jgi:hypothetical protein
MRRNIVNKLLIICCLLAIVSCKARKQVIAARKAADSTSSTNAAISKINSIRANQLNFNTFSGKAKTKLSINGSSNDVTLNIRISKGQKIWVSITAIAGIEVARALITPDSILVINKLQGLYFKKPFSYVYTYASKQVDYKSLEAIFVGNAMPQLLNDNATIKTDSLAVTLSGSLEELMYHLTVGLDLKVTKTDLTDQTGGMSLTVGNDQFIQAGTRVVPSQINIESLAGAKKIQASMHYNKVDFDLPLEFPFSIPSGYSAAN